MLPKHLKVYAEGLNLKAHRLGLDIVISDIRPGFVSTEQSDSKTHQKFWSAPVTRAAQQIIKAIDAKRRAQMLRADGGLLVFYLDGYPGHYCKFL